MKGWFLLLIVCSFLVVSCTEEASREQSIQNLVSSQPSYNSNRTDQPLPKSTETENLTFNQTIPAKEVSTTPIIERKCKYSTILNGGCKWNDVNKTSFIIKIQSASKKTIPGVWMIVTGESGGIKNIKREDEILSSGVRNYNMDYAALVKEIGEVKRFEVYPIEIINGTEFACLNQKIYTIPSAYCKRVEPISVDGVTGAATY